MPFIIIANGIFIHLSLLLFNYIRDTPLDLKPVINTEMILSQPEVVRGIHYKSECIIISRNLETVELRCKPDAAIETVSTKDYDNALNALISADLQIVTLGLEIIKTNICRPKK
ncbi:hypothetical protein JV34_21795 [Pectobacterium atrosepticum]|nr:hypothetical protein JV34_21795 [Pectobacterium atrosepticum]